MNCCGVIDPGGHQGYDHSCIGEPGHAGAHWCLLGHIWESKDDDE